MLKGIYWRLYVTTFHKYRSYSTTGYLSNLLYNLACSPVKLPEEKLEKEEVTVEIVEEAREWKKEWKEEENAYAKLSRWAAVHFIIAGALDDNTNPSNKRAPCLKAGRQTQLVSSHWPALLTSCFSTMPAICFSSQLN